MVFGWGKKKQPEKTKAPEQYRDITLDDISGILGSLEEVRTKTLISEAKLIRAALVPQFAELYKMATALEGDDLKMDEIDKRLRIIVERGKKQVVSIMKEETAPNLPEIGSIGDVAALDGKLNRALKRIGDVLGRQTRVIHLFAKKYADRLKTALSEVKDNRDSVRSLLERHKRLEGGVMQIHEKMTAISGIQKSLEKKSKRITVLQENLTEYEQKTKEASGDLDKLKNSKEYEQFLKIQEQIKELEPEQSRLRREINDQFTKISRPLGKYEYVTSLDKDQKNLLKVLTDDPYAALSSENKTNIIVILQSVKKGVISGSVSVKDEDKSAQLLDETTELLDSLVRSKSQYVQKEDALRQKQGVFDQNALRQAESNLQKCIQNRDDAGSRIAQLGAEIDEAQKTRPRLVVDIEHILREITSTKYRIGAENS